MAQPKDHADNEFTSLAHNNDHNKKMIIEEGGIGPLFKLLKEGHSTKAQIATNASLYNIAINQERVSFLMESVGVLVIFQVLRDSPIRVQAPVAS